MNQKKKLVSVSFLNTIGYDKYDRYVFFPLFKIVQYFSVFLNYFFLNKNMFVFFTIKNIEIHKYFFIIFEVEIKPAHKFPINLSFF